MEDEKGVKEAKPKEKSEDIIMVEKLENNQVKITTIEGVKIVDKKKDNSDTENGKSP